MTIAPASNQGRNLRSTANGLPRMRPCPRPYRRLGAVRIAIAFLRCKHPRARGNRLVAVLPLRCAIPGPLQVSQVEWRSYW